MDFAGISSALADPCAFHAWLSRVSCLRQADPCASHLCDHGSSGYLVSVSRPCAGYRYRAYRCLRYRNIGIMGFAGYIVGISRPLCMPCSCMSTMDFAGISSALADPCAIHAWLSRVSCLRQADPCASHLCDHGSGGYPVSVSRSLCEPWVSCLLVSSVRVRRRRSNRCRNWLRGESSKATHGTYNGGRSRRQRILVRGSRLESK
ncbi:hypothetical protein L210DRAFT_3039992 [Boletus edulis BED1]|uniref:Uncharacterized protein n=1 Tax=Boletus edulis BED1 TaxID=1328754 RepID=A0AAD4GH67_BOLED|nr:hypothetical protein L210DRAFT_3039992 [Boletus edulis BED1]